MNFTSLSWMNRFSVTFARRGQRLPSSLVSEKSLDGLAPPRRRGPGRRYLGSVVPSCRGKGVWLQSNECHVTREGVNRLKRSCRTTVRVCGTYDGKEVDLIMEKYQAGNRDRKNLEGGTSRGMQNGVFAMLLVNFALHAVAYFWNPAILHSLALSHAHPKPWQFITAAFVHANWDHLFGNAFSLLVFGRMVEEEEGAFGLWATYIICGICGNLASYLSSPGTASISLGASSAVFGLFVVGVLSKFRPSIRQLLEATILGSYVVKQVLQEVQMVASGSSVVAGAMTVGHMAHLGGALGGVFLVLFLSRLPAV